MDSLSGVEVEDSVVQEEALDAVDEREFEELPDVEREEVEDPDASDDVEGYRDDGYKDLLDSDLLEA
jgi:hypothetical protein